MSQRIVVLFNLKEGVSVAEYEAWAKSVDLPTVRGLQSIAGFDVFRATGVLGADGPPPYAYVEIIDVSDMSKFGEEVSTDTMQAVAGKFQAMTRDLSFILVEPLE